MAKKNENKANPNESELIDRNKKCPPGHIKTKVKDISTGKVVGYKCIPDPNA